MGAKALIIEEYHPGPGSRAEPYRREGGGGPSNLGWQANGAQVHASVTAHEAIMAGKTDQEVFEAAKAAYDQFMRANAVTKSAPNDFKPVDPSEIGLRQRYFQACVAMHTGKPCTLSGRQLADVLCMIDEPLIPYERWLEGVKLLG